MSDLLSAEERTALQETYAVTRGQTREVVRAEFPGVSQLDPERAAAFATALKRWLDLVAQDLSQLLRLPCAPRPPTSSPIARGMLPLADEEAFWGAVEGCPESYLLMAVPRAFAAAVCERIFGAPLELRPERALTPAERRLLGELAAGWMRSLHHAWKHYQVARCAAPELGQPGVEAASPHWLRWSGELVCGPVESALSLSLSPATTLLLMGEGGPAAPEHSPRAVIGRVGAVPVELRALLGRADFSLDELSSLRIGDVIALDRRAEDPVEVFIQERPFCQARAGMAGQTVAIELIGKESGESHGEQY
jgi:flagellar motor switch/type III secretory pathway protein FliN